MLTAYEFGEKFKKALLVKLYQAQLNYWNERLKDVAVKNAKAHGRWYSSVSKEYTIYYRNQNWQYEYLDWVDNIPTRFCLPLHPDFPQMEDEMAEIAEHFEAIKLEKYEADRFISGLVIIPAPARIFAEILGDTLYSACKDILQKYPVNEDVHWNHSAEIMLYTYIAKNQNIIRLMNQRLLLNLITLTSKQQKY